jgi:hypothetical protein
MGLHLSTTRSDVATSAAVTAKSSLSQLITALGDDENAFAEFRMFRDAADERVTALFPGLRPDLVEKLNESMKQMDNAAEALQKVAVTARMDKLAQPLADNLAAALEFQVAYLWAAFVTSVDEYLAIDGGAARRLAKKT